MGSLRRFFVVWMALLFACSVASAESVRPNVILIFTDDHGWADLGVHEVDADIHTPHTDQLARAGVTFTRGYVTAPPMCPLAGRHHHGDAPESIRRGR